MKDGKAMVLIVDDDTTSRQIARVLLQTQGYDTLEAESGEAALELTRVALPDLVILDVEMQGINGFDVVNHLKTEDRTRSIPVIMVTGRRPGVRMRALEAGAEDYLIKPVDAAELRTLVRNHLRLKEYGDLLADLNRVLETRVRRKPRSSRTVTARPSTC